MREGDAAFAKAEPSAEDTLATPGVPFAVVLF
jgi:hypothetical protein